MKRELGGPEGAPSPSVGTTVGVRSQVKQIVEPPPPGLLFAPDAEDDVV